jgi:hypothetical protein
MSSTRPTVVVLSTTLDPVTYAALGFLAALESPGKGHANVPIVRLVREELDRAHPGLWASLVAAAAELPEELTPRERAAALTLKARAQR